MFTKRTFIKSILAFFAIGIPKPLNSKPMAHIEDGFMHVVYFWLKNPSNPDDKSSFLASLTGYLKKIDVIQSEFVGSPATTNRDVIDGSYTYGLILSFKNQKDQDTYQKHPAHLKFVEESSNLWEKVVVYDSLRV